MKLKHLFYSIVCLVFAIALFSCNSNNDEYAIDGEESPEGRIISFAVEARPYSPSDSIAYPVLKTTKFTINNKSEYHIFNVDSLPVNTDIRTLKVTLQYASEIHARTDLVYPEGSTEYPKEWNETDSVKFIKVGDSYYPQFKVVAYNGYERTYKIDFNIHKQDPDVLDWERAKNNNVNFDLKVQGETKVILNADKSKFIAFTNNNSGVSCYTSPVNSLAWTDVSQAGVALPSNTLVNSLLTANNLHLILASDGVLYTSPVGETLTWTKHDAINIRSIVGLLPEVAVTKSAPLNEFLITYRDNTNTLVYAKTSDFATISEINLTSRNNNKVITGFPVQNYSSLQKTVNGENFVILVGGKDNDNQFAKKSWVIKNVSLADAVKSTPAEISVYPSVTSYGIPFDTQITSFLYDDKIYAISSDSLSLYSSSMGDGWAKANKKQKLDSDMAGMNMPSVVVDKDNYMWVFGGVSNKNAAYSQQIWRGRINRLIPKP